MNATTFSQKTLAAHVIQALTAAQKEGDRLSLDDLTEKLGVRRADVRAVLTRLHQQGVVDVLTMRLTIQGFALGLALEGRQLPAVRAARPATSRIAAA